MIHSRRLEYIRLHAQIQVPADTVHSNENGFLQATPFEHNEVANSQMYCLYIASMISKLHCAYLIADSSSSRECMGAYFQPLAVFSQPLVSLTRGTSTAASWGGSSKIVSGCSGMESGATEFSGVPGVVGSSLLVFTESVLTEKNAIL